MNPQKPAPRPGSPAPTCLAAATFRGQSYSQFLNKLRPSHLLAFSVVAGLAATPAKAQFTFTEGAQPTQNILTSQFTDLGPGPQANNMDYTDNAGPPGQTFAIGGTGNFRMSGLTILGRGDSGGGSSGATWTLQIGTVTGGAITAIDTETATVTYSANNDYLTFNLANNVTLSAGTQYEFSLYTSAGWYGLAHSTGDVYAGGAAFNNDSSVTGGGTARTFNGNGFVDPRALDYVFAVEGFALSAGPVWSGAAGTGGNLWDTTHTNFTGGTYADGTVVTFGDKDGNNNNVVTSNITIQAGGVAPAGVTMTNSTATPYTFTGAIKNTTITQTGNGTTTLGTPGDTTDNTGLSASISSGTVVLNKDSSATVHALAGLSVGAGAVAQLAGTGGDQIADAATVSVNGTLDLNGRSETVGALNGGAAGIVTSSVAGASTLTIGANGASATFGGVIQNGAGTVSLVVTGAGTSSLSGFNTFTGGTTVSGGTLALLVGGANGALAPGSNVTVNSGGTLRINASDALGFFTGSTNPVTVNTGGLMTTAPGVHATLSGVNLNGGTLGSLGVGDGLGNSSYIFDGTVKTTGGNTTSTISANAIYLRGNTNGLGEGTVVFNVPHGSTPSGVDLAVSSAISDNGNGLTKTGNGVLSLTGINTYTGATTINQGTVVISNNSALGNSQVNLAGGTLRLAGSPVGIGVKFLGGLIQNGANVGDGPSVTSVEGVTPIGNWNNVGGATGSNITLNDATGTTSGASITNFTSTNTWGTGSTDPLLNGYLDHTNTGNQSVTLTGIPYATYSVITYFGSDAANRTGSVTIGGTTYFYNTMGNSTGYVLTSDTAGTVNPASDYAIFTGQAGGDLTITMNRGNGNSGLFGFEIVSTSGNAPMALPNSLSVTADSTLDLTGASSSDLSGAVTIGANRLSITGGSTGTNVPYTLSLGDAGITLTGNATLSVANNGTGSGTVTVGGMSDLGGGFGLTKAGNGTLVLGGTASYTGPTSVSGGRLIVGASITGTSHVDIASGGILSGGALSVGGMIQTSGNGNVTIASGGALSPGDLQTAGTLTLTLNSGVGTAGSLLLQPGSASDFKLTLGVTIAGNGINDFVVVNGNLTLGGTLFVTEVGGPLTAGSQYELFSYTGTLSGSLAIDPVFLAEHPGSTIRTSVANEVLLSVVPEPGSLGLLICGAGMLAGHRRFRSRNRART